MGNINFICIFFFSQKQTYDEDNFNCFNEVNLKKLFNGCDIITDLLKICNTSSNDSINQLKPIAQNSKSNGKI